MVRELARVDAARRPAGAGRPHRPAAARARSATLMRERLRARYGDEVDDPPPLPPTPAPRTPWNRPITPHRRFAYTTIPLDDAKAIRRELRLHVQRRRHGAVLGHAAPLPAQARLRCRTSRSSPWCPVSIRTGDEDRTRTRTACRRCSPTWPRTSRTRSSACARVQQSMTAAKEQLRRHPGRDAAGLHAVRAAGHRRPGHADVQPAAHRRPDEPAVQPHHLQRARARPSRSTRPAPGSSTSTRSRRSPTARA